MMPRYLDVDVDVDDGDMEGVDGEWQVSPRQSLVVSRATPLTQHANCTVNKDTHALEI